jgi:hypothetical protein
MPVVSDGGDPLSLVQARLDRLGNTPVLSTSRLRNEWYLPSAFGAQGPVTVAMSCQCILRLCNRVP